MSPRRNVFSSLSPALPLLFAVAPPTLLAQGSVSPASRSSLEGSGSTTYPLGRHDMRLQQIHADLPANLTTLSGHAYRRDAIATRGAVDGFSTEMEVRISVAATTPDAPSRTFAQNHGSNVTVVLPRTVVSFPATGRPSTAPAPAFDLVVPYATPFVRPTGAIICVETIVYGNSTSRGADRNFTPYLDAHTLTRDGSTTQPGFRYGSGCPAQGSRTEHSASFSFDRSPANGLELTIASRDGAREGMAGGSPAAVTLLLGLNMDATPWPSAAANSCSLLTRIHAHVPLPGSADASGDWNGVLTGLDNLPIGLQFFAQAVSGNLFTGDLTFSDGSMLTVPGLESTPIAAARIASGSDHSASTGTTSFSVPVTSFF